MSTGAGVDMAILQGTLSEVFSRTGAGVGGVAFGMAPGSGKGLATSKLSVGAGTDNVNSFVDGVETRGTLLAAKDVDDSERSVGSSIFMTLFHPRVRRLLNLCEVGPVDDTDGDSTMLESLLLSRLGDLEAEALTTGSSTADWSFDLRLRCKVLIRRRSVWL
jgi:hypothetical protein